MPARIPIAAARQLAEKWACRQVIVCAFDGEVSHVVTFGKSVEDCDQAAQGGDRIKAALGWPESLNAVPSRVKTLQAKVAKLEAAIAWALGEGDSDFGEQEPSLTEQLSRRPYWWRTELRQRARAES